MKTFIKSISLIFFIITLSSKAQISTDVFLVFPHSPIARNNCGFGMNIFSSPLIPGYKKDPNHLEIRFGGGFYLCKLNDFSVLNVPLEAPQTGSSIVTFNNRTRGWNVMARFSLPSSKTINPYVDLFAGLRNFSCVMAIQPDSIQKCCDPPLPEKIDALNQFNYGVSAGLMISLGPNVKLDAGVTYSGSNQQGEIINIKSAHLQSNTVVVDRMDAPMKMLMFKVGITIYLRNIKQSLSGLCSSGGSSSGYSSSNSYHGSSGYSSYNSSGSYPHSSYNSSGGSCGGTHVSYSIRSSK